MMDSLIGVERALIVKAPHIDKILSGEIKKVKVVLTVAHLDHDETNHDVKDDRLKALCQYCHLNYDAREKQRRIKAKSKKCRQECKSYA